MKNQTSRPTGRKTRIPTPNAVQIVAAGRAPSEHEHARADEAEREQRSADDEERPLGGAVGPDGELVEDGDDEPEREHAPEPALVEPDRVGDELPDGPVGRRDVTRNLSHALDRISADYRSDAG